VICILVLILIYSHVDEAEHVAAEDGGERQLHVESVAARRLQLEHMMVMMIAMTPSLNASSLPLPIRFRFWPFFAHAIVLVEVGTIAFAIPT
jgi:hypothetical protein